MAFWGKHGLTMFLQFPATFGDADAEPVGHATVRAAKAAPLDESLQQGRPVAILAELAGR